MAPALIETFSTKQQVWIVDEVINDGETKWIGNSKITGTAEGFKIEVSDSTAECKENSPHAAAHFVSSVDYPYISREEEEKTDINVVAASQTHPNLDQLLTHPAMRRLIGVDLLK